MSQFEVTNVSTVTIPFRMVATDEFGTFPYWGGSEAHLAIKHIPGSDNELVQNMGRGAREITFEAWFDTQDDYDSLDELTGASGLLTLRQFAPWPAVLTEMGDPSHYPLDGAVSASLTFRSL